MLMCEDMKTKQEEIIDINRWAIRGESKLCGYIKTEAARSQRSVRQQMIYMLKRYIEMEEENNDG